jgi:hypothetical protein
MKRLLFLALVAVFAFGLLTSAALATGASGTVDMIAGGGNGHGWQVADLTVTIDTANHQVVLSAPQFWGDTMLESHIAIGTSLASIPVNKKGNPVPGMFPYSFAPGGLTVAWSDLGVPNDYAGPWYIAIHMVVCSGDTCECETAWATGCGGDGFNSATWGGGPWGTYLIFQP